MGIPSYFRHLLTNYNDIVFPVKNSHHHFTNVDRLYFDLNCAIHPCAKKIADMHIYTKKNKAKYEQKIITATIQYIIKIVSSIKPSSLVYIAIDGVAPRAKMEQQRSRRFKSVKEKEMIHDIKKKYDPKYVEQEQWDTNAITPGTPFMETLSNELKKFIQESELFHHLEVIFSNANCPGEGEHKIMNYIKHHTGNYIDIIYGLDADLIMLSLIRNKSSIYLLRERIHFGKSIDVEDVAFVYLDITKLRSYLLMEFDDLYLKNNNNKSLYIENSNHKEQLIDDYIFLCYLLGNDFIPHSPSLSIKDKGINVLLNIYVSLYIRHKSYLVNRKYMKINHQMLCELFSELAKIEDTLLVKKSKKIRKFKISYMKCNNLVERKLEELNKYPLLHKNRHRYLKMGQSGWMDRYYHTSFLLERKNYQVICKNFLEALLWNFHYYFDTCISWGWYYRYRHAPPFQDIRTFMNKDINNINHMTIEQIKPYEPCRQLFTVLPCKSMNLLPQSYRKLLMSNDLEIVRYYPIDFDVDTLFHIYFWQCLPILPIVDDTIIYAKLQKCTLTKEEKKRNTLENEFILSLNVQK